MTKKRNKIVYGKKGVLSPDEFDPKYERVSITVQLDGDLLDAIKKAANGKPYRPVLNTKLREIYLGEVEKK